MTHHPGPGGARLPHTRLRSVKRDPKTLRGRRAALSPEPNPQRAARGVPDRVCPPSAPACGLRGAPPSTLAGAPLSLAKMPLVHSAGSNRSDDGSEALPEGMGNLGFFPFNPPLCHQGPQVPGSAWVGARDRRLRLGVPSGGGNRDVFLSPGRLGVRGSLQELREAVAGRVRGSVPKGTRMPRSGGQERAGDADPC